LSSEFHLELPVSRQRGRNARKQEKIQKIRISRRPEGKGSSRNAPKEVQSVGKERKNRTRLANERFARPACGVRRR